MDRVYSSIVFDLYGGHMNCSCNMSTYPVDS
jgi:hypothetical protein